MHHRLPHERLPHQRALTAAVGAAIILFGLVASAPEASAEPATETPERSFTLGMGYGIDAALPHGVGPVYLPPGFPGWYAVQFRPDSRSSFEVSYQVTRNALARNASVGANARPHLHHLGLGYERSLSLGQFATISLGGTLRGALIRLMRYDRGEEAYGTAAGRINLLAYGELELGRGVPHLFLRVMVGPNLIVGPASNRRLVEDRVTNGFALNFILGGRLHLPPRRPSR